MSLQNQGQAQASTKTRHSRKATFQAQEHQNMDEPLPLHIYPVCEGLLPGSPIFQGVVHRREAAATDSFSSHPLTRLSAAHSLSAIDYPQTFSVFPNS